MVALESGALTKVGIPTVSEWTRRASTPQVRADASARIQVERATLLRSSLLRTVDAGGRYVT
jgi:hypothetical protein